MLRGWLSVHQYGLIHGARNQRVQDALEDVDRAADLGVEHLSIYQLTIESQTPFGERERRGEVLLGVKND